MKKKVVTVVVVAALLCLCLAGAVYAYLTATSSKSKVFTSGNVAGTLTGVTEGNVTGVYPTQEFSTEPAVQLAAGSQDAIAFIELKVPVDATAKIYDDEGNEDTSGILFKPGAVDTTKWVLLDSVSSDADEDVKVYVYGYKTRLSNTSDNTKATSAAFSKIVAANFVEEDKVSNAAVVITADLIQAKGITEETSFDKSDLESAYAKFDSQR